MRVGQGYDVHRLVEGRRLILGGTEVPHPRGLDGHSDADVLAHAVCDALLGAIGAGDLGCLFPSSEARFKDASGASLAAVVLERVAEAGFRIENVDSTVVAREPKLSPHRSAIEASLAAMLRIDRGQVNVKLKSGDGLGAVGRGEGIEARAVVLLRRRDDSSDRGDGPGFEGQGGDTR